MSDNNFSDSDPWGIPSEEPQESTQSTTDTAVEPRETAVDETNSIEDAGHVEPSESSDAVAGDDVVESASDDSVSSLIDQVTELADDEVEAVSDDEPLFAEHVAALESEIPAETVDSAVEAVEDELGIPSNDASDGALETMISSAMETEPSADEPADPAAPEEPTAARTGFGLSRMLAAAQSVFGDGDDDEEAPTLADEDLPADLPSWAVGSEPAESDELFSSFGSLSLDDAAAEEVEMVAEDAVDAADGEEPALDSEIAEAAAMASLVEELDAPSPDDDEITEITDVLEAEVSDSEDVVDDVVEVADDDIASALAFLGDPEDTTEIVDEAIEEVDVEVHDEVTAVDDTADEDAAASPFDLSPTSPVIEFSDPEPVDEHAEPELEATPFAALEDVEEPTEATGDWLDLGPSDEPAEVDTAEWSEAETAVEESPAPGSWLDLDDATTDEPSSEESGTQADVSELDTAAEAETADDIGADDDLERAVAELSSEEGDDIEHIEDVETPESTPWGDTDSTESSTEDAIDVPISTLPVPAAYSELEELPPATDAPAAFSLADTTQADSWGTNWDASAQGWIETESGETVWRPIVTTAPTLSGWSIETYLGVVAGDAELGDGADLSAARDAALNVAIHEAMTRGAHAVVGVQFSVQSVGERSIVTAMATAVTLATA